MITCSVVAVAASQACTTDVLRQASDEPTPQLTQHPAWSLPLGYKDDVFGAERVPSGADPITPIAFAGWRCSTSSRWSQRVATHIARMGTQRVALVLHGSTGQSVRAHDDQQSSQPRRDSHAYITGQIHSAVDDINERDVPGAMRGVGFELGERSNDQCQHADPTRLAGAFLGVNRDEVRVGRIATSTASR